jgi:hypothetical protein
MLLKNILGKLWTQLPILLQEPWTLLPFLLEELPAQLPILNRDSKNLREVFTP